MRRAFAIVVGFSTIVFGVVAVASAIGHGPAGFLLAASILWSSATFLADVFLGDAPAPPEPAEGPVSLTSVVRLGHERAEVAQMNIAIAAQQGPTVVVAVHRPDLDEVVDPPSVRTYVGETFEEALHTAAGEIDTDAVLITSAGTIPVRPAAESAAASISGRVGWVTGRSLVLGAENHAPDGRDRLGSGLRVRARAGGLYLWEADATVVSTALLRDHPMEPGRPWGRWLRQIAERGHCGTQTSQTLSLRVSGSDHGSFLPSTITRQRASVADFSDATRSGSVRVRFLALSLLLRELYALPLGVWLLSPVLVASLGSFPSDVDPVVFVALFMTLALARWLSARLTHRVPVTPRIDALNMAYAFPGSLMSLPAAVSARVHARQLHVPHQVVAWAALSLTAALAIPLMNGDAGSASSRTAAALALLHLPMLWYLGVRAAVESRWERALWRIPVDVAVTIDGRRARATNGSMSGMAVSCSQSQVPVGSVVETRIHLDDGPDIETRAVVTDRRPDRADLATLGLAMTLTPDDRMRWTEQLLAPVVDSATRADATFRTTHEMMARPRPKPPWLSILLDRLTVAGVALISAIALGALVLVVLGYRPLVVRGSSMTPTLPAGTTVIVEPTRAIDLRVGDIVTFDDPEGGDETITHRVRAIIPDGGGLRVETRGDANSVSEFWRVRADAMVDRHLATIPLVGHVPSNLSAHPHASLLGLAALLIAVSWMEGVARANRDREMVNQSECPGD